MWTTEFYKIIILPHNYQLLVRLSPTAYTRGGIKKNIMFSLATPRNHTGAMEV
jgi:hypothetical protein